MKKILNLIVSDDIDKILEHKLPWHDLDGSTVIISGASGFLPSYIVHVLSELKERGSNIRIVGLVRNLEKAKIRFSNLLEKIELLEQDIAKPLSRGIPKADFIVHAASQASPKYYGIDPVGTISANTIGTHQLLQHAKYSNCRSFLFFSSGEVYGEPINDSQSITELDFGYLNPTTLRACYAESKRVAETMCIAWYEQYGVPTKIVRPFHTYGPGMVLDDGRVFSDFVSDVVASRDIVLKSDGLAMRPFCYISDATLGFLTVMLKGEIGQAYNVGNPKNEISMLDLANTIVGLFPERRIGVRFDIKDGNKNYLKSPISRSNPSIDKISALGWSPSIDIRNGFKRTILSFL
jgi:UDP-glucuronate decarboxylase